MKSKLTFILALGILLSSCGHSNHDSGRSSETTVHEEHQHEEDSSPLQLNDGQKWKANESMMVYIRNMQNDAQAFESSAEKDYHALAASLQENIDQTISSCTMTGTAHDELHKWLLPLMEHVKALSEVGNEEDAEEIYHHVHHTLEQFDQYFE